MAAQSTTSNRRRLSRWTMGGIASAPSHRSSAGARKPMGSVQPIRFVDVHSTRVRLCPLPSRQINPQCPINRVVRPHQVIIDLEFSRPLLQVAAEVLEVPQVVLAEPPRIDQYFLVS